jgi:FkbM family methyltransferase
MFHSQYKQDEFLHTSVFKGFRNGVFVDVGAHDGKSLNNTLFFENELQWTGINIEPIPAVYETLIKTRPSCINLNCAISEVDGDADFLMNTGYTEMLSGIQSLYDPRHVERIQLENKHFGGTSTTVKVPTQRLETIFNKHAIEHVHYLSIDVEGAEYSVIKSINFDTVYIDVIGFENNYKDPSIDIMNYLQMKGFRLLKIGTDIFMINKTSQFRHS